MSGHAYPRDLANFVAEAWDKAVHDMVAGFEIREPLPEPSVLEHVISTCYQASLLRDEGRPVNFRLLLYRPECLPIEGSPPTGLHRLEFVEARPFNEDELRRLSPSADFYRSLIGARFGAGGDPEIWGIVASGPRWIQAAQGDRINTPALPDCPVVCVTGPGRIVVARSSVTVATLHAGRIIRPTSDVLESRWLQDAFAAVRAEIVFLHQQRTIQASIARRPIDEPLIGRVSRHLVRRIVNVIRASKHGATLLVLPPETAEQCEHRNLIHIKYRLTEGEPRRRFRTLILEILDVLTRHDADVQPEVPVGWEEYLASRDERLEELDEAVAEFANLLAGFSAVDGAVVLTRRFEVLGYGAEISGALPNVDEVDRALDADARHTSREATAGVGTRHRSVYRLCQHIPEILAVVVSQDGGVRLVKRLDGHVAFWDQLSTGVRDV